VDNELEVIHHEMEEKRASLAEKLDTLETHVMGTVHEATDAVSHTVEDVKSVVGHTVEDVKSVVDTVKDSIQGTVESVTDSVQHLFDVSRHFRRHPWGMFCGAVAVGFVGGRLLTPKEPEEEAAQTVTPPAPPVAPARKAEREESKTEREESKTGFDEILQRVKGLALGSLMGMVRDFLAQSLPESMKADVMGVVDDITTKLGGKLQPAASPPESDGANPSPSSGEQTHEEHTQTRTDEPRHNGGEKEQRPQGGKKGQGAGGRFDRRNPPPRR